MTKARLKVLERIFTAEIEDRLPFCFGGKQDPKIALQLEQDYMIMRYEKRLGGRFPVTIKGWTLTHRGRIAYCQSCAASDLTP